MKTRLLVSGAIILTSMALITVYTQYLDLRKQAGLDSRYPIVSNTPPDSLIPNLPSYPGPHPRYTGRPDDPTLYPIPFGEHGPIQSLFSGPMQYPFLCQTEESGLGQPIVDNQAGWGIPVYAENKHSTLKYSFKTSTIIGYSKDCQVPTRLHYLYYPPGQTHLPRRIDVSLPLAQSREIPPHDSDLIVRAESGTINRHFYTLLMPVSNKDRPYQFDASRWNGKLIYFFQGGINIGFQQGPLRMYRIMKDIRHLFEEGYAVAYSTANHTQNTFNITLQEDTARRVKRQFVARYGKPEFTIGFGPSGGGIQQYLLAQNAPGLLDGGVALIAYPDMVTQVHYALDCELLEYYFDQLATDTQFWRNPDVREAVLGLSVSNTPHEGKQPRLWWLNDVASLLRLEWPDSKPPASECNAGWRGSPPLINNPGFHQKWQRFDRKIRRSVNWTYWQDNRMAYGTDSKGNAFSPWSNVGVQYGLSALQQGIIQPEQFIELNARIGSWKDNATMTPPRLWHVSGDSRLYRMTPYGEHNMTHEGSAMEHAPRYQGRLDAAKAAYHSGQVYMGNLDIPLMDVRMYLDNEQNIHHTWAALSTRQRLIQAGSDTRLSPIWITSKPYNPMFDAVDVMDDWLSNAKESGDLINSRPSAASDTCFNTSGQIIARGEGVWDGSWNQQADGTCTQEMPFYKGSRQVAGDSIAGLTFQCSLISIEEAIKQGIYTVDMTPYQEQLRAIYPTGVCDYTQPDLAQPRNIFRHQLATQPVFKLETETVSVP